MTKKEYLRQYITAEQRCIDIESRIEDLKRKYAVKAIVYSDMPKSHNSERDLSEYAAELDGFQRDLREARTYAIKKQREIYRAVQSVEDPRLRRILELRYVDGKKWQEIADKVGKDIRHIIRLHGEALEKFTIPMS